MDHGFWHYIQIIFPNWSVQWFSIVFCSRSSVISGFAIKSLINFEYIWMRQLFICFAYECVVIYALFISNTEFISKTELGWQKVTCPCMCISSWHPALFCPSLLCGLLLVAQRFDYRKVLCNFVLSVKQKKKETYSMWSHTEEE